MPLLHCNADAPHVSLVVTCKGRLHHLKQTLPTMLGQQCSWPFEVIVVDYGCPQRTFEWCGDLDVRGLTVMKVLDGTETFNLCRARNCGARLAQGETLGFVDADVMVDRDWLQTAVPLLLNGHCGLVTIPMTMIGNRWDRCGTCLVTRDLFHEIRGYDERFSGWGGDDEDFYARCRAVRPHGVFSAGYLTPIGHSHAERVAHYAVKSLCDSSARNLRHWVEREAVNPAGYGHGEFHVYRGSTERHLQGWKATPRLRRGVRRPAAAIEHARSDSV